MCLKSFVINRVSFPTYVNVANLCGVCCCSVCCDVSCAGCGSGVVGICDGILEINKATMIKADKGNSIVVTYLDTYYNKIQAFTEDNNFTRVGSDPSKKY